MPKVSIRGPIISSNDQWIYDFFGFEATSPKSVRDAIEKANGQALDVEINSGGGSVFMGSEIYTELKSYQGDVTVKIMGLAGSAASVVAMAGKRVLMSPTAQFMYHNARGGFSGDYKDMDHGSEILKNTNTTIANAYRLKTGRSYEDLLKEMDNETWLTAQKAKELGFVDEIMFENEHQLIASADMAGMLPQEVINKIRNMIPNPAQKNEADILMSQLNLLKLKEVQ